MRISSTKWKKMWGLLFLHLLTVLSSSFVSHYQVLLHILNDRSLSEHHFPLDQFFFSFWQKGILTELSAYIFFIFLRCVINCCKWYLLHLFVSFSATAMCVCSLSNHDVGAEVCIVHSSKVQCSVDVKVSICGHKICTSFDNWEFIKTCITYCMSHNVPLADHYWYSSMDFM